MNQTPILYTAGFNYIGASGQINVWNPKVDLPNDFIEKWAVWKIWKRRS